MPHLVVLYTRNLDAETDMTKLCRSLADAMLSIRDESDKQVFPTGGVRVLAYPAAHSAVADGQRDYAFAYLNLRMGRGRSEEVRKRTGEHLLATARSHFAPLFASRYLGITLQIDEGPEIFDAKHSTIHPLFAGR
jgi:5-carboxymethyl-2-hydroxymuconate isomerase